MTQKQSIRIDEVCSGQGAEVTEVHCMISSKKGNKTLEKMLDECLDESYRGVDNENRVKERLIGLVSVPYLFGTI